MAESNREVQAVLEAIRRVVDNWVCQCCGGEKWEPSERLVNLQHVDGGIVAATGHGALAIACIRWLRPSSHDGATPGIHGPARP